MKKIPPRSFSRAELEDMVRRWDFSEDEWAYRDRLIAAFSEAVSLWTSEELSEMDTMELLEKVGEQNLEVGIQMLEYLSDTIRQHLEN